MRHTHIIAKDWDIMQRSIPPRYDTRLESGAMKRACVAADNKTPGYSKTYAESASTWLHLEGRERQLKWRLQVVASPNQTAEFILYQKLLTITKARGVTIRKNLCFVEYQVWKLKSGHDPGLPNMHCHSSVTLGYGSFIICLGGVSVPPLSSAAEPSARSE